MARDPDEWIGLSDHAAYLWTDRSGVGGYGPRVAWFEATVVTEPHGLDADEVRYHRPSGTVLLARNGVLVTVLDIDTAKPALRKAVRRLGDVADLSIGGEQR